MGPTEAVRELFVTQYLNPAKRRGEKRFSVTAGEIHNALRFHNRVPVVCQALKSEKLLSENGLRIVDKKGPPSGLSTTVTYTYEIVESRPVQGRFEGLINLRGAGKHLFKRGGESFLKQERRELEAGSSRKTSE
ncbi:MAG: ATPase [Acidobacteriales bacterium]|nr:ATPase [Terriglobales bacterium]